MEINLDLTLPDTEELFLPAIGTSEVVYDITGAVDAPAAKPRGSGDPGNLQARPKPKNGGGNDTAMQKPS